MNDKSLFEVKTVPQNNYKFQYSTPCNRCGSRDHASGSCTTAFLHEKKLRKQQAEAGRQEEKLAARRGYHG